jgi:hypothetical protein
MENSSHYSLFPGAKWCLPYSYVRGTEGLRISLGLHTCKYCRVSLHHAYVIITTEVILVYKLSERCHLAPAVETA